MRTYVLVKRKRKPILMNIFEVTLVVEQRNQRTMKYNAFRWRLPMSFSFLLRCKTPAKVLTSRYVPSRLMCRCILSHLIRGRKRTGHLGVTARAHDKHGLWLYLPMMDLGQQLHSREDFQTWLAAAYPYSHRAGG